MAPLQAWVTEHKLTSIGALWATAVGASFAYNGARTPLKPSLRLIHARMHAQALTLAVLSGATMLHYYNKTDNVDSDIAGNFNNSNLSSNSMSFDEEERFGWWF
ncbi:Hypoxia-responsive family protein [Rhynchospora pubera]|uniref:Hypoxia-responsive family protein n=1 Tax=Rhynchospora pubera TaxID=906938 RepID=A0AAV8BR02_9POAL|nr:Hypoxia-responsive family protein [Rhynchospora pubera]